MNYQEKLGEASIPKDEQEIKTTEYDHDEKARPEIMPLVSAFAHLTRAQSIRVFWRLYATGLLVSLGGMYCGYASGVVGSIIANEGFVVQFATMTDPVTGKPALDSMYVGLWNAANFAAQIAIQLIAPITADRFGRKFNMWALTFFLTLATVLEIISKDWKVFLAARLSSGFTGGLLGASVMVYMSEVAMPQFRGGLLSSFSLSFAIGQLFLAIGLKILNDSNPMSFRNIFYSQFVFMGIWLGPMILLPETPVWYATKGSHDAGKKSLRRLIGNVEGYDVEHEYAVIKYEVDQSIALQHVRSDNDWRAFFTGINLKRTVIATLPFTFQNFCGGPLFFGYAAYFFSLVNIKDPFLGSLVIQLILVVGILTAFYFVDKVVRRSLVLWGGFFMGLLCLIVGGLGFLKQTSSMGGVLIALCGTWAFLYANSMAPIGWLGLVEVSSPLLRAKTASFASLIQSFSGLVFNYTVPLMLSNQHAGWGQKIGLFFGGICLLYLIPVWLLYPETKGRTYEELDELFERGIPAWKFATTKTAHEARVEDMLHGPV